MRHCEEGKARRSNLITNNDRRLLRRHIVPPRNDRVRKIGLFGGTFNPIHIGHVKMAEAARKEYKLDVVYFIPCGVPPHKPKKGLLPAKLRYELVKKAIKGKKYFKILDIEIGEKKKCYTVDTIKELKSKKNSALNAHSSALFFLIGQDEFEKLHTWTKPNELAKLVTFLVLPRRKRTGEPANWRAGEKNIKVPNVKNLKWNLVHTKPIDVSASEIRKPLIP